MVDKYNVELQVGDRVVFTANTCIYKGVITGITKQKAQIMLTNDSNVISSSRKRIIYPDKIVKI